jgi:predicted ATPase/class 3 adenylate cyclase
MDTSNDVAYPSGTITFLFTDVENSTQRWDRTTTAMKAAVRLHDEIVREEVSEWSGRVFKTVGDAFCVAFATADDAIRAAVGIQLRIAREDWSNIDGLLVRVALHAGSADERSGDYFGPTLNAVARILSVTYGGQILASNVVVELSSGELPRTISFDDLGDHRLRGLETPIRLFQVRAPGTKINFPPLVSIANVPNNLPPSVSSFVGRQDDLANITLSLDQQRLVTITGTPGIGKTRTAIRAASDSRDKFSDGVWFVDLAALSDGALIAFSVANAIGCGATSSGDPMDDVVRYLRHRKTLIILDNCEHLIDDVAGLSDAVMTGCAQVTLLCTSRAPLRIDGERQYSLQGLDVPDQRLLADMNAAGVMQYPAVMLFVDRACAANRRFVLKDSEASSVSDIVNRLDGIPYAIELAASQMHLFAVTELNGRLRNHFDVLGTAVRNSPPRQRTLYSMMEWSYALLNEDEKVVFGRLCVFVGGWTLDAAESVCAYDMVKRTHVAAIIGSLIEKSLVIAEPAGHNTRYRLLDWTRFYAADKLRLRKGRYVVARRHARWIETIGKAFSVKADQSLEDALPIVEHEIDNIRAAIDWALRPGGDVQLAGRIIGSLRVFWTHRLKAEGRQYIQTALSRLSAAKPSRTVLSLFRALASTEIGPARAVTARKIIALAESSGDRIDLASGYLHLAYSYYETGEISAADQSCVRALSEYRDEDLESLPYVQALGIRALVLSAQPDKRQEARALYADVSSRMENLNEATGVVFTQANLADLEFAAGKSDLAVEIASSALELARSRHLVFEAALLANLSMYRLALGDIDHARRACAESLRLTVPLQQEPFSQLLVAAAILAIERDGSDGAMLLGYVEEACARSGLHLHYVASDRVWSIVRQSLRNRFSGSQLVDLQLQGAKLSEAAAIDLALRRL